MGSRLLTGFIIVALILGAGYFIVSKRAEQKNIPESKAHQSMTITSSAFQQNDSIPRAYTCDAGNTNPPLLIENVPQGAKSLALIVDDPDAPGGTWVHWLIWNIDPSTKEIAGHSVPLRATEGTTSFGKPGYGGPCPPSGTHRYFFKLYALDTMLNLFPETDKAAFESAIKGHVLDSAELIGLYRRA